MSWEPSNTAMKPILGLLLLLFLVAILSGCEEKPQYSEDIARETRLREEWQMRALTAENALEDACDLLKTAYLEQDELNGPWYVHAAIRITASCQPTRSLGDPHYRGRDANGFYNMEKAP